MMKKKNKNGLRVYFNRWQGTFSDLTKKTTEVKQRSVINDCNNSFCVHLICFGFALSVFTAKTLFNFFFFFFIS